MDVEMEKIWKKMETELNSSFSILENGMLMMRKRICLPGDKALKDEVFNRSAWIKTYRSYWEHQDVKDLKKYYWWPRMKREIVEYMAKYAICQQVKVEHQRPTGPLQPLLIPEWKWELITMDFVFRLPRSKKSNNAI